MSNKDTIQVLEEQTLFEFLQKAFPASTKNTLRDWLKDGRVSVNGKMVKIGNHMLAKGQQVAISPKKRIIENKIVILYQDDDLVVVDKPAGVLSVAAAFEKGKTVHAALKQALNRKEVYPVHRLDQETSGVLLFALTSKAHELLKEKFAKHDIERGYTAIVEGRLPNKSGTWTSHLYEDANYFVRSVEPEESVGKEAITHYKVLGTTGPFSYLELRLETGRKNQIRVHCHDAGCPIVGDKKYGGKTNPVKRLCLHAHLLEFSHPISKKKMSFFSPIPDAYRRLVPRHE